jgi:regulator of protease activity HflC (stomatin/prohibitin superfamily)
VVADGGRETRENNPGIRQVLTFFLVALAVGVPALLLGGPLVGYFAFVLFGLLFVLFFSGNRRRLALLLYLFLAAALLIGGLVHAWLNDVGTVARLGDLPLLGWLLGQAAVRSVLAVLAGGAGAALAVGLPLWLTIFISAEWMLALREAYGFDRKLATKLLFYLATGIGGAVIVVDEGEIKMTLPQGPLDKFGAPVVVVVKPYNAVVLVRGTAVSRIEGSELIKLQKGEMIEAVIDLRPQGRSYEREALTQDNVPLTVKGGVSFRIESASDTRRRRPREGHEIGQFKGVISGPYPVYRSTLYRAVFGVPAGKDWRSQTEGTASGRVGGAIRDSRIDEIFVVDEEERVSLERTTLQDIINRAKSGTIEAARNWGVQVGGVGVNTIEMPEEAQKAFLTRWREPWIGWTDVRKAESRLHVARLEAEASIEKARGRQHATYMTGLGKAQALEEQYKRALNTIMNQLMDIEDEKLRVQMVLELIRSLQPVDRRVLNLLLEGRGIRGLGPGSATDHPEESETEE